MENTEDEIDLDVSNDSEELPLTAAQIIELMENAWLNEKFAPELLPHKSEIVDCLLGQITYMEKNIANLESGDFQRSLHQMEIDRLRFVVTSYLRTRVEKIEVFAYHISKQEEERLEKNVASYLSNSEQKFLESYRDGINKHFMEVFSLCPNIPVEDWKSEPIAPNMHSFVFAKSKTEVEGVIIDDGNEEDEGLVDLRTGSQMIISYNSIAPLIKNEQVALI